MVNLYVCAMKSLSRCVHDIGSGRSVLEASFEGINGFKVEREGLFNIMADCRAVWIQLYSQLTRTLYCMPSQCVASDTWVSEG